MTGGSIKQLWGAEKQSSTAAIPAQTPVELPTQGAIPPTHWNFELGFRLQEDNARFHTQSTKNGHALTETDFFLRRARVSMSLTYKDYLEFEISGEFAEGPEWKNALVNYSTKNYLTKLGLFTTPFGNEGVGSTKHILFIEPASVNAFLAGGKDLGIVFSNETDTQRTLYYQIGAVSGSGIEQASHDTIPDYLINLKYHEQLFQKLHLWVGTSFTRGLQQAKTDDKISLKAESRSGINLFSVKLKPGKEYVREKFSTDISLVGDRWLFKAEFLQAKYQFDRWAVIRGGYVSASYFIAGTQHELKYGLVSKPKIKNPTPTGWGSWEVVMRQSWHDVDPYFYNPDKTILGAAETADDMQHSRANTLGINWYPHDSMRLMLNWISIGAHNNRIGDFNNIKDAAET